MHHFNAISRGQMSAAEARDLILSRWDGPDTPILAYDALMVWVWTAVSQHHTASDLKDWMRLAQDLRTRAGRMGKPELAAGFQALEDLIGMCVQMSARPRLQDLAGKPEVRAVLDALTAAPNTARSRKEIASATGRSEGSVAQIVNLLAWAGAVETAGFADPVRITASGRAALHSQGETAERVSATPH